MTHGFEMQSSVFCDERFCSGSGDHDSCDSKRPRQMKGVAMQVKNDDSHYVTDGTSSKRIKLATALVVW